MKRLLRAGYPGIYIRKLQKGHKELAVRNKKRNDGVADYAIELRLSQGLSSGVGSTPRIGSGVA